MKILVVEDSQSHAHIIHLILKKIPKAQILFATDAFEGYAMLKVVSDIGLVILDQDMPYTKGMSLLKKIKGEPALDHVSVVISSADENVQDFLDAGATSCLLKPYQSADLVDLVEKTFSN